MIMKNKKYSLKSPDTCIVQKLQYFSLNVECSVKNVSALKIYINPCF